MSRRAYWILLVAMAVLALSIGIGSYLFIDAHFPIPHSVPPGPVDTRQFTIGSLADILSVSYGLPLTLVGAVIGFILTSMGILFTTRQGDVELLKFTKEALEPTITNYTALVDSIERLRWLTLGATEILISLISEHGCTDKDFDVLDAFLDNLDKEDREDLRARRDGIEHELDKTADAIRSALRAIASDTYANAFRKRQRKKDLKAGRGTGSTEYLRNIGIRFPEHYNEFISDNIHDIARNIARFSKFTRVAHVYHAYKIAPSETKTDHLSILGSSILTQTLNLKTPLVRGDATIVKVHINLGRAWLLTLIDFVPEKSVISDLFGNLLQDRAGIVMRYLDLAGPDRDVFGAPSVFEEARIQGGMPERLVILELSDGTTVFYDKKKHKNLPADDYHEFE